MYNICIYVYICMYMYIKTVYKIWLYQQSPKKINEAN